MLYFRKTARDSVSARCLATVSAAALLLTMPVAAKAADATAQTAQTQAAQAPSVEEIVVTGSRIVRDGYQAPTPVSVLGAEDLQAAATTNIADSVNRLPVFSNSTTPHNSSSTISTGTSGVNNLNLRGLGPNRTLVLLDGARVAGTTLAGFNNNGSAVDVNSFPAGLVARVDVVTGGASAAYGSDALAGVVNFVLDHNFTGIKGEIEGSVTTFGDDRGWKINLTAGMPFANDRGHVLLFGEINYNDGIYGNPRPFERVGTQIFNNPAYTATNGQPRLITRDATGLATAAPGGLIVSGPLKGIYFGPGGIPAQLNYGSIVSGNQMVGGDWNFTRIDDKLNLDLNLEAKNAFTRFSYDLTDNVELFAQWQWSFTRTDNTNSVPQFNLGNLTIASDNAFLPASVKAQFAANGVTSAAFGTTNIDIGGIQAHTERTFRRYVLGGNGKFDAFDTSWKWDAYWQFSETWVSAHVPNAIINNNLRAGLDAVQAPNGAIVCRSTLTNPTNGCVPYNGLGIGVNSRAALNYVTGTGYALTTIDESAAGGTVRGEPFSTWAGPVSLATGLEWRKESAGGIASVLDEQNAFFAGNFHASKGSFNVTEGFVETVIPLAKNAAWAQAFDLNAAVRATSYSTSGYVTTWKVGGTWTPIEDIRFRATRSRDIRAPNLGDLFNAGRSGTGTVLDDFQANKPTTLVSAVLGNPALQPEKADTTGLGFVVSPRFFRGFNASFDYYNIDIDGAIFSLDTQSIIDRCYSGIAPQLCPFIIRGAPAAGQTIGDITRIEVKPANILSQSERGFDFESSYKLLLSDLDSKWDGDVTLRLLATHIISLKTVDINSVTEGANALADGLGTGNSGALQAPAWRYTASAALHLAPIVATLTMRGIGPGQLNNAFVVCSSGCPTATTANPTSDFNHVNAWHLFDLALSYKFAGDANSTAEAFLVIENFTNANPPKIPGNTANGYYSGQANQNFYDRLGRFFHAGVRFKM